MKHVPPLLALLLLAAPALRAAPDEQDLFLVRPVDLPTGLERDGRLEAADVRRVTLDLEAFSGRLRALEVHPALRHGGRVEQGAVLLRVDPAPVERELRAAREALAAAKASLAQDEADHALQASAAQDALEQAQAAARDATEELEHFRAVEGPLMLASAALSLQAHEHHVDDQKEELAQLEAIYQGAELAPETQEIVLERARRNLRRAEEGLVQQRARTRAVTEREHPDRLRALEEQARWAAARLEQAQERQRLDALRREEQLAAARRGARDAEERLAELEGDLERLTVTAPVGGAVEATDLRPGDPVAPGQAITTVHDTSRLVVRFEAAEDDLRLLAPGAKVRLRPLAFGEVALRGVVAAVQEVSGGGEGPTYATLVEVEGGHPLLRVGLRCRVEAQGALARRALAVPRRAVTVSGGRATCRVWANDRATPVEVILGPGNRELVQVLRGLVAGDTVVLPEDE
ncbi:MAG: HlyD family efflux transporter periplasmic adaptor subunit [Planctomycetes bacterium]|nr:HlyD family efflux transporter periplasmic adaptor subunit [Planctomycetota bacterium]